MNEQQAREAARQIMANDPPGTEIWLTSQGMAMHPHHGHADGYHAYILDNGQVVARKFHAYDLPSPPNTPSGS